MSLQGCVDNFELCQTWAQGGLCLRNSTFMIFNCRESCGTCGFKSPFDKQEQMVEGKQVTNSLVESPNGIAHKDDFCKFFHLTRQTFDCRL